MQPNSERNPVEEMQQAMEEGIFSFVMPEVEEEEQDTTEQTEQSQSPPVQQTPPSPPPVRQQSETPAQQQVSTLPLFLLCSVIFQWSINGGVSCKNT